MMRFMPPVIAHRGASRDAPENTMAAFRKAETTGSHWIEFDVMLSADLKPVIFHDETVDRTTNAHGKLSDFSYEALRKLDAGSWFSPEFADERVPSLEEVVDFLKASKMAANIEVKPIAGQEDEAAERTIDILSKVFEQPDDHILFSSFSLTVLQSLRKYSPNCHLGLLLSEWRPDWLSLAEELNCVSVHVNEHALNKSWVKDIKAANKLLLSYTVNDPDRARTLLDWGVDAVFSDVPGVIALSFQSDKSSIRSADIRNGKVGE